MDRRNDKSDIIFFIVGVIGLLMFLFFLAQFIVNVNARNSAIKTTAVISKITSSNDGDSHTAYVQYWVDDRMYDVKLSYYSAFLREGKKINVYYKPDNPWQIVDSSLLNDILPLLFASFLIFIGFASTIITNKTKHLNDYLRANGKKIKATFIEIEVEKTIKESPDKLIVVKRENAIPMLIFEYTDSSQNRHTFKIDCPPGDMGRLAPLIGKEVDVYIDSNDSSSYFVDIDSLFT